MRANGPLRQPVGTPMRAGPEATVCPRRDDASRPSMLIHRVFARRGLTGSTAIERPERLSLIGSIFNPPRDRTDGLISPHSRAVRPILTGSVG